ncbi:unnamed protein product, partial [marine sediment metagenome]
GGEEREGCREGRREDNQAEAAGGTTEHLIFKLGFKTRVSINCGATSFILLPHD